jgi:hypothetical protein
MHRFSTNPHAGGVGRAEHISLESEPAESRTVPNPSRPLLQYALSKGGRGVTTCVSILPDHFVSVATQRSGSSSDLHTIDLRFVEPRPFAIRKVPWRFMYVTIAITLLTAVTTAICIQWPNVGQKIGGELTAVALGAFSIAGYLLCYLLTTESLLFLSSHGRARVITIAGRLGTIRRAQACAADLVARIKIAQKQFKQTRQAYLRDEMREHARLYEQRTFPEEQYNEAKRRILRAHE